MPRRIKADDPSGFGRPAKGTNPGPVLDPANGQSENAVESLGSTAKTDTGFDGNAQPGAIPAESNPIPTGPVSGPGPVYVSPLELAPGDPPKKRRGRQPGSRNTPKPETTQETLPDFVKTLASVEKMLYSVHLMGAGVLNVPELAMSRETAKDCADAVADVAKHYNYGVDAKTMAWFNLAAVLGGHWVGAGIAVYRRETTKPKPVLVPPQRKDDPMIQPLESVYTMHDNTASVNEGSES